MWDLSGVDEARVSASVGADYGALWWGSSTPFVASVLPPQIVTLPLGQPRPHPSLSSPSLLVPSQLLFEPRSHTPQSRGLQASSQEFLLVFRRAFYEGSVAIGEWPTNKHHTNPTASGCI